jgi:LemA protein
MILGLALLAVPLIFAVWFALTYNILVQDRNRCDEAWADIDAELKRRYDLVPNLVKVVRGYAQHEQQVLKIVSQARTAAMANSGSPQSQADDENKLVHGLRRLLAVAENYPDLKANRNFAELQSELANTEDRIQRSRRFYNANVRGYRDRLQGFPSNLVARMFTFPSREFFEIEDVSQQEAPVVRVGQAS